MNSNRRPPKDHKLVTKYIGCPSEFAGKSPEEVYDFLKKYAGDLVEPVIETEWYSDSDSEFYITGFVELTEEEKDQAKIRRDVVRKAAKQRLEKKKEDDLKLLRKLQERYPDATP